MRIFALLFSLFSWLAVSADEPARAGVVVAPLQTDSYVGYGHWLSPQESDLGNVKFVFGSFIVTIDAVTTMGISQVIAAEANKYYLLDGQRLTVKAPAHIFALDGKKLATLKANALLYLSQLPHMFIMRFKDGVAFKLTNANK